MANSRHGLNGSFYPGFEALSTDEESGRLFDDLKIDRDEALRRFFTPHIGFEDVTPTEEYIFGNHATQFVGLNPRSSFVAPQIRDSYDVDRITRTGKSIRDSADGQLQNCGVAFIDPENVEAYLNDLNAYFQSNISVDDLTAHPQFGCYIITIFGHNRQFGIASANIETTGHPDSGVLMFAKVFRNPGFWRAIEAQAAENTGEAPSMWTRARSIVFYKKLRIRDGAPPTQDEIAQKFNVSTDQIWRAERFDALPDPIKQLVIDDRLKYSGAVELDTLLENYPEEYVVDLAVRLAQRYASVPVIIDEVKRRKAAASLTPEIRHLIDRGKITLSQAKELSRLAGLIDADDLNRLATYFVATDADIDTMRSQILRVLDERTSGAMQLFDQVDEDPARTELLRLEARRLRDTSVAEDIRRVMAGIANRFRDIDALYGSGLIGLAADLKPVLNGSPDDFFARLDSIIDRVDEVDVEEVQEMAVILENAGRRVNGHQPQLHTLIDQTVRLLRLCAEETSATQLARRTELGRVVVRVHDDKPLVEQQVMF